MNIYWKDWCLSWSFNTLATWCKEIGKALILGNTEGKTRCGQPRTRWLDSITNSMAMNLSKLQDIGEDRGAWGAAALRVTKSWTWLTMTKQQQRHTDTEGRWPWKNKGIDWSYATTIKECLGLPGPGRDKKGSSHRGLLKSMALTIPLIVYFFPPEQ